MKKRIIVPILLSSAFLITLWGCGQTKSIGEENILYQQNKIIPKSIAAEAKKALSFYPNLKDVEIEFQFKKNTSKSFMQAQPDFNDVFTGKKGRSYNIFISSPFNIEGQEFTIDDVPSDVIIGWLGHELGHIVDYRNRSTAAMAIFGLKYITSKNYIKKAERAADVYAINHGMSDYILKTKNFIINNSELSDAYKKRIARLYLSPEEIMVLVNEYEENLEKMQDEES